MKSSTQSSWLCHLTTVTVLALVGTRCPTSALAQDDTTAAKARYESGVRHFDLSEYDQALGDFKEAYRNKPDPVFLYNIAQCHRKLGHTDDAITFYQSYLRRAPDAKNRDEVERRIAELESLRAAENASIASTGGNTQPSPGSSETQERAVAQTSIPPTTTAALDLSSRDNPEAQPSGAIYTRWWFWTAAGAVAAGTATVVAIMVTRDPTKVPSSGLGTQRALP
jgi:tetratricopeptide (TPR) repeat protein